MSFTAEVKEELSRIKESDIRAQKAEFSALVQICGTLELKGKGAYDLHLETETGSVARLLLKNAHSLYDLETKLVERRSILHNTRNYLVILESQPKLDFVLKDLGILDVNNHVSGSLAPQVHQSPQAEAAFLRGIFMAGGYIAKPTESFHLEMKFARENLAYEVSQLLRKAGIKTRPKERGHATIVRIKNFNEIVRFLYSIGGERIVQAFQNVRHLKAVKNNVNRMVNAEVANLERVSRAGAEQMRAINQIRQTGVYALLPEALQHFCELREKYPDASFVQLGKKCDPPLSKSAINNQWQRLKAIANKAPGAF